MENIKIKTSTGSYNIVIGNKIIPNMSHIAHSYDNVLILSNTVVGKLYSEYVKSSINHSNLFYFEMEDGEEYKNLDTVSKVYDFMIENNFTRKSLIITLGGGVVCDLGGFVAGTFMRGIDYIQMPTSLLAQVDASIGGKVAVDHPDCKNLIGLFKQPKSVIIDVNFLKTLEAKEIKSGLGEIIKHSIISPNKDYFNFLKLNAHKIKSLEENFLIFMIKGSCLIKKYYVELDEFEENERAFLNFGHNYAHALESIFEYKNISHGEAVSKGIMFELELSHLKYSIANSYIYEIQNLFEIFEIDSKPIFIPLDLLMKKLSTDKKNSFGNINFVLIENVAIDKNKLIKTSIREDLINKTNNKNTDNIIKAVIDIGTNSCRLLIANVEKNQNSPTTIKKVLYKNTEIVKLGEDVNKNRFLKETAIKRTLDCLKKYRETARNYGCSEIKCFATSAVRDSSNREEFIDLVKKSADIEVLCISGEDEGILNFKGANLAFNKKILTIDIGGGSTEFSMGDSSNIDFIKSINVGSVRATELFFKDNYSEENINNCIKWTEENIDFLSTINLDEVQLVALAGTATTQVSVKEKMSVYNSDKVHLHILTLEDLYKNLDLFLSKNLEERKEIPGLDPKRADVITAGTIILITILKKLKKEAVTISEYDNLFGALIQL